MRVNNAALAFDAIQQQMDRILCERRPDGTGGERVDCRKDTVNVTVVPKQAQCLVIGDVFTLCLVETEQGDGTTMVSNEGVVGQDAFDLAGSGGCADQRSNLTAAGLCQMGQEERGGIEGL